MSQKITIHASRRDDVGKGASRRLRRSGDVVPGIIYGAELEALPVTLGVNELTKAMQNEAFFSQVIDVAIDGRSQQAVVRDVQRNPASGKVLHMDFLRVRADRELEVNIPLHFVGQDRCKGVRLGGGTINHLMTEVEISCLPANLPEYIEVDVTELEVGQIVHLSDLKLPAGVSIVALEHGDDRAVLSVQAPRVEIEEAEGAPAAPGAVPTTSAREGEAD